jgi:uncharacterized iron-regulated membrane protein
VRRLILNIHLFIALIAGAFIVLLGATGGVLAFEPELDRLRHPHLSYVAPGGKVLSLREIGDAVSQKSGGEPIVAYMPAVSPELSSQVVLPSGIVCVNQYTGEVLGARTRGQTFLGLARALHVRLAGGSAGREIMKWSGVAILFYSRLPPAYTSGGQASVCGFAAAGGAEVFGSICTMRSAFFHFCP